MGKLVEILEEAIIKPGSQCRPSLVLLQTASILSEDTPVF